MAESSTDRARYVFSVKEFGDGTPWIMLERGGSSLAVLGGGFLGLELKKGTSMNQAEKIAQLLRRSVQAVSYTSFNK